MRLRFPMPVAGLMALALSGVGMVAATIPASAHADLASSTPGDGADLSGNPPYVSLSYGSPVVGVQVFRVTDEAGAPVSLGAIEHLQGGRLIRARLPRLPIGHYQVRWRMVSIDSHETAGTFAFSVGIGATTGGTQSGGVSIPQAAARWIFLMGALLALGGLVSDRFFWKPAHLPGVAVPAPPIATWLAIGLAGAGAQAVIVGRSQLSSTLAGSFLDQVASARATVYSVAEVGLVIAALILFRYRRRPLVAVAAAIALALAALSGHPGDTQTWWAAPANVVHVIAVAIWIGGLAHLVQVGFALRSAGAVDTLVRGAKRYASVALWAVVIVITTGIVEALAQIPTPGQLTGSGYGRTLLVKVAIVGIALGLALLARFGGLATRRSVNARVLRLVTRYEAGVLVVVIGAAAVLANASAPAPTASLPPPRLHSPVLELAEFDGHYLVRLQADSQNLTALVTLPNGKAADAPIDIRTILPTGDYIDVTPRSCGRGCATGDYPWEAGTTAVLVITRSLGDAGSAGFNVTWPPAPADPSRLATVTSKLIGTPQLAYTETVTSAQGTSAPADRVESGASLARRIGLGASGIALLPQQQRADQLLLYAAESRTYYELDLSANGTLVHELEVTARGRLERRWRL